MKIKTFHVFLLILTSSPLIANDIAIEAALQQLPQRIAAQQAAANQAEVEAKQHEKTMANQAAMFQYLSKANPSLRQSDLDQMSEADIRALFRKSFMAEGKGLLEAREMSEKVTIPPPR